MNTSAALAVEKHLRFIHPDSHVFLNSESTEAVTQEMFNVMATSYSLGVLIQGCHWNIMGPHFLDLHKLFGALYQALNRSVDELAERLRALGVEAPYTPAQFESASGISVKPQLKGERDMLESSIHGYQSLVKITHQAIQTCGKHEDFVSGHLLTKQLTQQEDAAWQLMTLSREQGPR